MNFSGRKSNIYSKFPAFARSAVRAVAIIFAWSKAMFPPSVILKDVFPTQEIYRAGGDEFMVLLRDTTIEQLNDYAKQIKEKSNQTESIRFAVGLCLEEDSRQIYTAMKLADVNMYEDKKKYYEQFPEQKRN